MDFVITATSAWTPAGPGVAALTDLLTDGGDAFQPTPPYPADGLSCPTCAPVPGLEREHPAQTLLHTVVSQALAQVSVPLARTGLVVGTTSGDISGPWERWHRALLEQAVIDKAVLDEAESAKLSDEPAPPPEPGRDTPTLRVAQQLGLGGPTATVSVACASGTSAFALATGWLADGLVDAVVVAGVEALSLFIHAGFNGLGALSKGAAHPFSASRDGLTLGEGAAAFVVETFRNQPTALAFVRGVGLSSDAVHISAPHREGRGAASAMRAALDDAGLSPQDVDMVSVHGTGTVFNDAMEAHALNTVFSGQPVAFHGVKHAIGHTLGAAGAIEAAVVVEALRSGRQPPPPAEIAPDLPITAVQDPPPPRVALSTSSAFGGSNASLVLALSPGSPVREPVTLRVSEPVTVDLPAGRIDWSAEWPDAPDRFKRMNRYVRTGVLAIARLLANEPPDPDIGIVLASPSSCRAVDLRYHARLVKRGAAQASRLDFVYTIPGGPAAEAAILFDLRGPPLYLVGPMAQAEAEARRLVRWGRARRLIALGLDVPANDQPARAVARLVEAVRVEAVVSP